MADRITIRVCDGRVYVAGSEVFVGDAYSLLDAIDSASRTGRAELLVTPNVDQVLEMVSNPSFRDLFAEAAIRVLDGMPLVAFARMRGAVNVRRHTGADLLPDVVRASVERGWSVVITGGDPRTCELASERLRCRFPGASVAAVPFPEIGSIDDSSAKVVVENLKEIRPNIVFMCLGSPKQELWFGRWRTQLPPALYVGAGAAVDFAAGRVRRAPRWMQRVGLEWVWRLGSEPKRLARRYLIRGPRILGIFVRSLRPAPGSS
jgi:N-acetylglucosaminyldiphosphoundecaprenol N-acetyl-beta-D-mannosaminyltransferase